MKFTLSVNFSVNTIKARKSRALAHIHTPSLTLNTQWMDRTNSLCKCWAVSYLHRSCVGFPKKNFLKKSRKDGEAKIREVLASQYFEKSI